MERTVLIADDHSLIREGLKQLLGRLGVQQVVEVDNGLAAISEAKRLQPDMVLLDVAMPYAGGLEVFTEVRRWCPDTRLVVLTGLTSPALLGQLIEEGVDGLFLKGEDVDDLEAALVAILAGGRVISESVQGLVGDRRALGLTPREMEVLTLVVAGFSNAEIGDRLSISANTVNNHRANLMTKLDVHSISELMALAVREGLLEGNKQL